MISDADLLAHVLPSSEDELPKLRQLERAAVAHVEQRTGRVFSLESTVTEYLHRKGDVIALSSVPDGAALTTFEQWDGTAWSAVDSTGYFVDGSLVYFQTVSSYPVTTTTVPTRYKVTYTAGYAQGDAAEAVDAPEDVKQAVLLLVGHWYENRETVVVGSSASALDHAVDALLSPHTRLSV